MERAPVTGYALRRLGTVLVALVVMSLLVFLGTHALPSSPAALILGQYSTPETLAALEHKLGLDLPLPLQYWRWASALLLGDMGQSLVMERPVAPMLWDGFGRSAVLAVAAMTVVATVGVAMGVVAAVWRGKRPDHAVSIFAYLGISMPEFYWNLVLILVFGGVFHLLPTSGSGDLGDGLARYASFLVLPVISARGSFAHRRGKARATTSVNRAAITDARIGNAIQQVGGKIGQAVDRGQHEDCRLHQRQILPLQCEDQQPAEPRTGKDGFDGNDTADQEAEILRQDGNGRHQRVA